MRVKVLRPTVIQGQGRAVGDVLDVTAQDMRILGRRVELVETAPEPEPETTTSTTAEHASLIAEARTARRK